MSKNNIKVLRKQKSISQAELAKLSSVCRKALSNYENGKGNPTRETLEKLAKALDCKISDFF